MRIVKRQAPDGLASGGGGGRQAFDDFVVASENAGVFVAQRPPDRACQRRDVDQHARLVGDLAVVHGIGEHEAAFGVGGPDLDRDAGHRRQYVPGTNRRARRHVLGERHQRDDIDGCAAAGRSQDRAGNDGRAAEIALHHPHILIGLERDTAGVERDALAGQYDRRFVAAGQVLDDQQARRSGRALADPPVCAHPQSLQVFLVQHLDVDIGKASKLCLHAIDEGFRVEDIGRFRTHVPSEEDAVGEKPEIVVERFPGAIVTQQSHDGPFAAVRGLCLMPVETIAAQPVAERDARRRCAGPGVFVGPQNLHGTAGRIAQQGRRGSAEVFGADAPDGFAADADEVDARVRDYAVKR